jgi:hypothetical protein
MKITKLIVPMVALSVTYNYPNSQVEAVTPCLQGCIAAQALGAKLCCAATPYFPPAYAACMLTVGAAFTACCIAC